MTLCYSQACLSGWAYEKYKNVFKNSNSKDNILINQNFESSLLGKYTESQLDLDFGSHIWSEGLKEGRATIVDDSDPKRGKVLRVLYPSSGVTSKQSGVSWRIPLEGNFESIYISYKVKFDKDFIFAKGGKLPGLMGGNYSSGLRRSDGKTGFSVRMMWFENGRITFYVYHTNQMNDEGDIMEWRSNGKAISFQPEVWYRIGEKVVMNTPGKNDGMIYGWIDGKLCFKKTHINFRNVNKYSVDSLFFSTFFGGHTADYKSPKDQYAFFDDILISQKPIILEDLNLK